MHHCTYSFVPIRATTTGYYYYVPKQHNSTSHAQVNSPCLLLVELPVLSEEIDYDVYYGDLRTFVMENLPPVPVMNMADYTVDSDEEDTSIKDSSGKRLLWLSHQNEETVCRESACCHRLSSCC